MRLLVLFILILVHIQFVYFSYHGPHADMQERKGRYIFSSVQKEKQPVGVYRAQQRIKQYRPRKIIKMRTQAAPTISYATVEFVEGDTDPYILDRVLYTNGKDLLFHIIVSDVDGGLDYVNLTVNGFLWISFVYTGTGWDADVYMWIPNTLIVAGWDDNSSATYFNASFTLRPLKGTDAEIEQGVYSINITAMNINGENTTSSLQNVDSICFDYEAPDTISIKEYLPINTLDNSTKDPIDPTDRVMIVLGIDDNFRVKHVYVNYSRDYEHFYIVDAWYNGTEYWYEKWVADMPPLPPGQVIYEVTAIDAAGNEYSRGFVYYVRDPYSPILQNITIISKHGFYADEPIDISVLVVENANSSIKKVNCTLYQSQDNLTWELLTTANFEFSKLVEGICIYQNVSGELEVWNNASEWNLTINIGYYTYLKIVIGIYDAGDNTITTTRYLLIEKRHVLICCSNITTRYGDDTNISFSITDQINGSTVSLYFELYINDELACYGYSNATGPTTITMSFTEIGTFTILIYVPENQKYMAAEKTIYVTVLKEILSPTFDIDALQVDTFRFYSEVRDDEGNFVYGCELWIFINISGRWYLVTSEIRENPYEAYLKPPVELENGKYELWVCIYGGKYYKNYNTTLMLCVRKTIYNKIYLSSNITLGQTIVGEYTVSDPDGIVNCSVEIYDPYGRKYELYYNICWINNTVVAIKFEFELSVHYYPGTWWMWIRVTDGSGSTTINKEKINVSDVSLVIVVISPENQTAYNSKTIDFLVEVYYGVRPATGEDVIVSVIVLDMGISTTLSYENECFCGTMVLSDGNHTIVIKANDERRVSKVLIIVTIQAGKKLVSPTTIMPIGIGIGLITSGVIIKKKKKAGRS